MPGYSSVIVQKVQVMPIRAVTVAYRVVCDAALRGALFFHDDSWKKPVTKRSCGHRGIFVWHSCGIHVIRAVIVEFVQSKPHHESHEYGTTVTR